MPAKKDLGTLLGKETTPPEIRRGQGMRLSTEGGEDRTSADAHERISAQSQKRESAGPRRINRGYALREDLVKRLKRVALEEDKKLYEVMEDALVEYLARHEEEQTRVRTEE